MQMDEVIIFRAPKRLKTFYTELAKEYVDLNVKPGALMRLDLEKSMMERQSKKEEVKP